MRIIAYSLSFSICFIFLLANFTVAQHPVFYKIDDEDNLPSNEVYRVLQDNFGYIWLGTDAGLYRYDGFNFKHFTNSKQNGKGISFLLLDKQQNIWCKNFFGQVYRTDGDSLKIVYQTKTSNPSEPQFAIDDDNNLWIHRKNQIIKYNQKRDSLESYLIGEKENNIISLFYFKHSIFITFSDLNGYRFDLKNKKAHRIESPKGVNILSQNCMTIIHKDELLCLVETDQVGEKFIIYKIVDDKFIEYYTFGELDLNTRIYSLYSDDKNLWYTSSQGASMIEQNNNGHSHFSSLYLKGKKVSYMTRDREGMYWFSSLQDGLFVVPAPEVINLNNQNSLLADKNVSFVQQSIDGKILIGLYIGKVFEFNPITGDLVEKYNAPDKQFITVKSIQQEKNYTIISRGNLCIIDNYTQKQYYPQISNIRDFAIVDDTLIMVSPQVILKQSLNSLIKNSGTPYLTIQKTGGRAVEYNTKSETVFFALSDGTFELRKNGRWEEITFEGRRIYTNSMSYNNGILWMATVSDGVYGLEENKIKYHYHSGNLLSENETRHVKAYNNKIWLCTENNLYCIDYTNNKVSKYNNYNSINPRDINAIAVSNGLVYLATHKGFLFFPENMSWKNLIAPNLEIIGFTMNGNPIQYDSNLSLPYSNKNLKINFISTSFKSRGKFTYQYRLIGLDTNWVEVPANNASINFTRIPSGSFHLEIRAINESGIFSAVKSIHIYVNRPFWQKWWFLLVIIILFLSLVALVFNVRIKYIKRKAEQENKLAASQLTAIKSQMNPHFLFNTLNSLQDLILKHDIKNSNYYLGKYSSLMRMVLNVSGKDEISISEEIEMLDTYLQLEKLRFGDEFLYNIEIDPNIDTEHTNIPPMLLQPFIENAIKHGLLHKKGNKKILIQLLLKPSLVCVITDNGVGRKKADEINARHREKHQSFATEATQKRIELLNSFGDNKYKFSIEDLWEGDIAQGTKVTIHLAK